MDERKEPSVWYVATVALTIFATVVVFAGIFGGTETVIAAAGQ